MRKPVKCRACQREIVFLPTGHRTAAGQEKTMPVDAESVKESDTKFDPALGHMTHFATCPSAERFRKTGR